jgi:FAD/FMN-containing dehydrogenase
VTNPPTPDLLPALIRLVGAAQVLVEPADIAPFSTDWRGRYSGTPLCVVRPGTVDEVAGVVRLCAQADVAIVPQGGNTGLCGGATPIGGEVLVSLVRLNRIRDVDALNNAITVESGCTLQQVQEAAAKAGRLFPLALASEGSATIGGNLSTNAGGVQVLRYGTMRELTLGLEVVLPSGEIWHGLRALRKDNTGYDLKHLFIGAEGTLGLITAATLKLYPRPRYQSTAWLAVRDPASAVRVLAALRESLDNTVTAFELMSDVALGLVAQHIDGAPLPLQQAPAWQVLVEFSGSAALADEVPQALMALREIGEISDAVIASNDTQAQAMWRLRENISEAQKREGVSIKHDISVPVSRMADFIARADAQLTQQFPGLRIVCFGHVGDGNVHYNLSKSLTQDNAAFIKSAPIANRIVHDLVTEFGGSISAEHGLGQLKRDEIARYKSSVELDMQRAIKRALDPTGRMNPGKLLPSCRH